MQAHIMLCLRKDPKTTPSPLAAPLARALRPAATSSTSMYALTAFALLDGLSFYMYITLDVIFSGRARFAAIAPMNHCGAAVGLGWPRYGRGDIHAEEKTIAGRAG